MHPGGIPDIGDLEPGKGASNPTPGPSGKRQKGSRQWLVEFALDQEVLGSIPFFREPAVLKFVRRQHRQKKVWKITLATCCMGIVLEQNIN